MLFALIINTEDSQVVSFVKGTKEQAMKSFEGNLQGLIESRDAFTIGLVDEDELTQASLAVIGGDGLVFDSTVVYLRYVDPSMDFDETDYMFHA